MDRSILVPGSRRGNGRCPWLKTTAMIERHLLRYALAAADTGSFCAGPL